MSLKHIFSLIVVLALFATALADYQLPSYEVDLSVAPEHRYDHIITPEKVALIHKAVDAFFPPNSTAMQDVKKVFERLLSSNATEEGLFHPDYLAEARGISRITGLEMTDVLMITAYYDLSAAGACTGIISRDSTGRIVHGRNLDFSNADALRPLAAIINYTDPTNPFRSYTAVTFLSMVGFDTVWKPGAFTIEQNERAMGPITSNMYDLFVRHRIATFSKIRAVAESATTFDEAVSQIEDAQLPSNSYFIMAGAKTSEGGIIMAHNHTGVVESRTIGDSTDPWYVLETNYDPSKTPPFGDRRRAVGRRLMKNSTGPTSFGPMDMMAVMGSKEHNAAEGERPLNNKETIFTCVMSAQPPAVFQCIGRS